MEIRELNKADIEFIYKNRMENDFPPEEIRPWDMFERSFSMGLYTGYGLYENEKLLSYATFTFSNNNDTILLDYYAVDSSLRGKGIGANFLSELSKKLQDKLILLEVENPKFSKNDDDLSVRTRRINFYKRCGAYLSNTTSKVFEADFAIMYISRKGEKSDGEIASAIKEIYRSMFTKEILEKYVTVYEKQNI
ncbi:hypothetical protein B5F08_10200 [Anaeromassilibacillus sp. An172]|uniref:GNAT family N-acetyltransferase n=1 Tax=Anaeromassilibacillus sp. An172 TaxID=1965570 RepID=UPI000B368FF0|nr:GNAT family N-acetyltransferase [Anaeromassilibacillus sp. An172]OUP76715.1 hypothetical protein B5F08_10200 [Anaeromassilibacillus sp. An172]